jgi:hypothetical protein
MKVFYGDKSYTALETTTESIEKLNFMFYFNSEVVIV